MSMTSQSVVEVDAMDVGSTTPAEEEFATPRLSVERTSSSCQPQKSGDNASPLPSRAILNRAQTPEVTTVRGVVDVGLQDPHQDTSVAGATISQEPTVVGSSVGTGPPAIELAMSSAGSPPHNQRLKTPAASQILSSSSPAPAAFSNPSLSVKEDKEVARLKEAVDGVSAHTLHKWVRKQWRDLLFGPFDEAHVSYILRACMKNAPSSTVERGLREALNIPSHRTAITPNILKQATPDEVLTLVPQNILDEALARRLQRAPVNDVVRWLADANRLGFKRDDALDETDERVTKDNLAARRHSRGDAIMLDSPQQPAPHFPRNSDVVLGPNDPPLNEPETDAATQRQSLVINLQKQHLEPQNRTSPQNFPNLPPSAPIPGPSQGSAATLTPIQRPSLQHARASGSPHSLKCSVCGFSCPTQSGFLFHTGKKICQRQPVSTSWQWGCENCGQNFTTKQGQSYHLLKQVCHGRGTPEKGVLDDSTVGKTDAVAKAQLNQIPPHDTISPPNRPQFSKPLSASDSRIGPPQSQQPPRGGAQVQIPRFHVQTNSPAPATPQMQTQRAQINPARYQGVQALPEIDPNARVSPSQLSVAKQIEMDRQIKFEDQRYQNALAAIDPQLPLADQEKRRISLKNANASKKSQIRKSFGVTLRMRDKDKAASRAIAIATAASSNPTQPHPSTSQPAPYFPHVPTHVMLPSSGFSPINAATPRKNPSPLGGSANYPPPQGGESGPTRFSTQQSQRSGITNPENLNMSGFGILRTESHRKKRQRTSSGSDTPVTAPVADWVSPSAHTQTPYRPLSAGREFTILETSAEDASKKHLKRVPIGAAQAKWESLQPRKTQTPETNGHGKRKASDADTADTMSARADSNSIQEPIEIGSSSDSEAVKPLASGAKKAVVEVTISEVSGDVVDADKPLPSTEDSESEPAGESRPSSGDAGREVFMAKRGGRRS